MWYKLILINFIVGIFSYAFYASKSQRHPVEYGLRTAVNKAHAISTHTDPNNISSKSIRFEVRPGDFSFNGSRSQIKMEPKFTKHVEFDINIAEYEYENGFFSLMDWHTTPEYQKHYPSDKRNKLSPLAIQLEEGEFVFINRANSIKNKVPSRYARFSIKPGWNRIEIDIRESDRDSGKITLKVNDTIQVFDNVATTWDMDFPTFLKFGIYRSARYTKTSVIEFRNVIADGQILMPDFSKRAYGENVRKHLNGL